MNLGGVGLEYGTEYLFLSEIEDAPSRIYIYISPRSAALLTHKVKFAVTSLDTKVVTYRRPIPLPHTITLLLMILLSIQ